MKRKGRIRRTILCCMVASLLCGGCAAADKTATLPLEQVKKGNYSAKISCHDPQILLGKDDVYYMTGSHQIIAESKDLSDWNYIANGNRMFDNIFSGDLPAFSYVGKNEEGGYSIWASNIFYNEVMGKYLMYFCTSSSYIKSNLTLAVSDTPGGPYTYTDTFLYSGWDESTLGKTNVKEVLGKDADLSRYYEYGAYNNKKWPNCIDPAVFTDEDGKMWMVYGSWSGGIFLLELDEKTGLPIHPKESSESVDPYYGYRLIGGGHHAVEGPYIWYDRESGYYYLFVSYGNLQREGGYQIREFRSKKPTGPYEDPAGNTLQDQEDYFNYGLKLAGNYSLPSLEKGYMAPGGQSVFADREGNLMITYHQRFDQGDEYHEPRIHRLYRNGDDWLVMAPFEYHEEEKQPKEKTYRQDEINGTFYMLNHGHDVGSKLIEAKEVNFSDGNISGGMTGTYKVKKGSAEVELVIDSVPYNGVIEDTIDEAGNRVRTITAAGRNNESIWAVQYQGK